MAKKEANWVEIDPSTLELETATAYTEYKTAYTKMKNARVLFESKMAQPVEMPEGKRLVFGYNFGKLSVAIVDDDRKPAKPVQSKQTLAQFLASQAASGNRH